MMGENNMINTEIRQLRDSIIALTNASPLPIEIKRLLFLEIQTGINNEANRVIAEEKQEAKEKQENKEIK